MSNIRYMGVSHRTEDINEAMTKVNAEINFLLSGSQVPFWRANAEKLNSAFQLRDNLFRIICDGTKA